MSRAASTIQQSIRTKWPKGYAAPRECGVMDALYGGFGAALADGESQTEKLFVEIHPREAEALLTDFERVLGPDPCGRDKQEQSLTQRQRRAHQRWIATGGQSIPYFIEIARNLGSEIEVEEFWPSVANSMVSGDALIPEGEQFVWLVKLKLINPDWFITGRNEAWDSLFTFENSDIECVLRRLKPAHTTLIFAYQEAVSA